MGKWNRFHFTLHCERPFLPLEEKVFLVCDTEKKIQLQVGERGRGRRTVDLGIEGASRLDVN